MKPTTHCAGLRPGSRSWERGRAHCTQAGAYLKKPVDRDALLSAIAEAMAGTPKP